MSLHIVPAQRGALNYLLWIDLNIDILSLACRVDLVVPDAIKPRMKPSIMQDLVYVA